MYMVGKQFPGYEGIYEISTHGEVKSIRNNKILKPFITKCGYKQVELNLNGKAKKFLIHRLVAQVFIPNPHKKTQVNHIDGNKTNNDMSNLEWTTPAENTKHAYKNGLGPSGERNGAHKLTNEDVVWIKTHYIKNSKEYGTKALGKKFGVDHKTIWSIVNNKTWEGIK